MAERAKLIKENPAYGNIICRCEGVSEGEIVDAITRTLGATSLDGIKRRVRQGMGRCQAGFCTPKTMEILARERNMKMEEEVYGLRKMNSGFIREQTKREILFKSNLIYGKMNILSRKMFNTKSLSA